MMVLQRFAEKLGHCGCCDVYCLIVIQGFEGFAFRSFFPESVDHAIFTRHGAGPPAGRIAALRKVEADNILITGVAYPLVHRFDDAIGVKER